jgi:hypothetical protein
VGLQAVGGGQTWLGARQLPGVAGMKSHCVIDASQRGQGLWNTAAEESMALGVLPGDNR